MSDDPYQISGPALISFSGGRTSAFMLWNIIQSHGGTLPGDVRVAFANTGKEREETLRFVYECGSRWGVHIHWLEWRDGKPGFDEVGFNSASRNGEPFEALIDKKRRLPNWQERWCTQYLKVVPLHALAATFGWSPGQYAEVIGLRNDEGRRILKALHNARFKVVKGKEVERKPGSRLALPLAAAKVARADVMAFWAKQDFDLGLRPWEGNCDLCFLKGRAIRKHIIRDAPHRAAWWARKEAEHSGFFNKRDLVSDLIDEVRRLPSFFDATEGDDEHDAECGLVCGGSHE